MSVSLTFQDNGLIKKLRQISESETEVMKELILTGLRVETIAKEHVAVDTGRLKTSIFTVWQGSPTSRPYTDSKGKGHVAKFFTKPKSLEVIVGTNVEYAWIIEQRGGRDGKGQYYLSNAYKSAVEELKERIAKKIL